MSYWVVPSHDINTGVKPQGSVLTTAMMENSPWIINRHSRLFATSLTEGRVAGYGSARAQELRC